MRGTYLLSLITIGLLGAILLSPVPSAAKPTKQTQASAGAELERILGDLEDVVLQLQMADSLDGEEVSSMRRELAVIYRDLGALKQRLNNNYEGDPKPTPGNNSKWQPYTRSEQEVTPNGARFNGWNRDADVGFYFGNYGEILVTVNNVEYRAVWTIDDAYEGRVEARIDSQQDGDVILTVTDENGEHEFLLQDGGLGQLMIRGREGYHATVTKSAS